MLTCKHLLNPCTPATSAPRRNSFSAKEELLMVLLCICTHVDITLYLSLSLYIYIYIYILLVRHGNHQDVFCLVSVVDIIQRLWFPSLFFVNGFRLRRKRLFMVSVVGFLYGFRRGRKTLFMVSVAGFWWILPPQEDPTL